MKHCPKCSKTYDDSWKICLSDSTPLEDSQPTGAFSERPQPVATQTLKETYRFTWYIKLFPIALALLLGAFLMWGEVKKIT